MLACRRLYPGAVVALAGSLNRNVRDFYRLHADELDVVEASRIDPDEVTRLIVVDATDPTRLAELEPVARRADVEIVRFDHHPESGSSAGVVRSEDGALTTTLVAVLAEREIDVTPLEATVLALGIHEDTGSLTHATTTERDVEASAWCLRHGARQEAIGEYLHAPLGEDERAVLDALLAAGETHVIEGLDVLVAAVSWPTYVDGVSNLAHKLVDLTDCRALVCLAEMDRRVVCVARSRTPSFDASQVASALGGGGHPQAASATFHGSLADAHRLVLGALPNAVEPSTTAGEIMSTPPRFVSLDDTVAHAMALCQRHRQSGIQVGDPSRLAGVVTREDLDKAVGHGLSHAPVKAVMSSKSATCTESTPLTELQRLLTSSPVGRVPVVRDGLVVGVVTRGDVLRALGETPERVAEQPPPTELRERLLALEGLEEVFDAIQAVSGPFDGVYLVGGTVRDILLGEPGFDLDIAVEGDGIALGRTLAEALHGRAVPHEKFGTAVVKSPAGRVDVATTRTEFYDEPAALPSVEQASIRQDLYRRDFTINAMAVSLKGEDFGRLVDFFGGRADLERGVVRVLHGLSFIDDPTRIFRAIRYENRYGFRMDGHTLSLARACIDMGLVGELSSARLRDELEPAPSEEQIVDSILRLEEIGLAGSIHPHLAADAETAALIERVDGILAHSRPSRRPGRRARRRPARW